MTESEQIRWHAAGHLAAAALIAHKHPGAASRVMDVVVTFVHHDSVSAPEVVKSKVIAAAINPDANLQDIIMLEKWFVDPMNTQIEKTGGRF